MSVLPESSRTVIRYRVACSLLLLDLVADDGAADRPRDRGRGVAAAAADLVADHAAGDATDDRPGVERLVIGRTVDLDRLDPSFVGADRWFGERDARSGRHEKAMTVTVTP
jgi:hypothetical protein